MCVCFVCRVYDIGIDVRFGQGRYRDTRIVTLGTRYQLENRTQHTLAFSQRHFVREQVWIFLAFSFISIVGMAFIIFPAVTHWHALSDFSCLLAQAFFKWWLTTWHFMREFIKCLSSTRDAVLRHHIPVSFLLFVMLWCFFVFCFFVFTAGNY